LFIVRWKEFSIVNKSKAKFKLRLKKLFLVALDFGFIFSSLDVMIVDENQVQEALSLHLLPPILLMGSRYVFSSSILCCVMDNSSSIKKECM